MRSSEYFLSLYGYIYTYPNAFILEANLELIVDSVNTCNYINNSPILDFKKIR